MTALGTSIQTIFGWLFGTTGENATTGIVPGFWNWLTSDGVIEYFLIGVVISFVLFAVGICKSVFWGR